VDCPPVRVTVCGLTDGNLSRHLGVLQEAGLVEADAAFQPVAGTEREIPAELVLLAMGFSGPEPDGVVGQLGVDLDERSNVARDASYAAYERRTKRRIPVVVLERR